jgi:uncharacterized protein (DUF302 family)
MASPNHQMSFVFHPLYDARPHPFDAFLISGPGIALSEAGQEFLTPTASHESEQVKWSNSVGQGIFMAPNAISGITHVATNHSVDATVEKLTTILQSSGITLFALIDHSGEAAKAGLKMPPTRLLIFGSPNAGTPLMLAAPSTAIDLPLKILISEDPQGKVWLSYNTPDYLQQRHNFPAEFLKNIAAVETLANKAAQ